MSYLQDNSTFPFTSSKDPNVKSIGWLAGRFAYPKSDDIPETVMDKLWQCCKLLVNEMRGFHKCDLCNPSVGIVGERNWEIISPLGSAQIRVFAADGTVFAAPNLIYHYIEAHHYCPPSEFIDALLHGPEPSSDKYFELLKSYNLTWRTHSPIELFKDLLTEKDEEMASITAEALQKHADESIFSDLSALVMKYENGLVRDALVRCFANMLNPKAKNVLKELAKDEAVRNIALETLDLIETSPPDERVLGFYSSR